MQSTKESNNKSCKHLHFLQDYKCVPSGNQKFYTHLRSSHPLEHLSQIQEIRHVNKWSSAKTASVGIKIVQIYSTKIINSDMYLKKEPLKQFTSYLPTVTMRLV